MRRSLFASPDLAIYIMAFFILACLPIKVQAVILKNSDKQCLLAWDYTCDWPAVNPQTRQQCGRNFECWELVNTNPIQIVTGKCLVALNCKGINYTGLDGKTTGVGGLGGIVGDIFKAALPQLLQQLMKGGQSGSGGGSSGGAGTGVGSYGCSTYYQVTVPSTDPCAYYIPPTSQSLLNTGTQSTASTELLNALNSGANTNLNVGAEGGGATATNVSDQLLGGLQNTGASQEVPATSDERPVDTNLATQKVNLKSGTEGNIEIRDTGATVIARARDAEANTEVAGFYGSDTFGGEQPQGIVARMCQNRPWASSIVTYVIPPSFFDSLCAWRGYQVGTPPPAPTVVTKTTITPPPVQTPQPQPSAPAIPPEIDIWAVPERVSLGARTSIFWNTKGVASCTITSPDGSFNEHTLSGGAATVPITGATAFTISCLTPDGKPVTDYVTVQLAI